MRPRFKLERRQFSLQAHFTDPVFDLFKDFPSLVRHLVRGLSSHGVRLTDITLDSPGGSVGEVNLMLTWPNLATARLFLARFDFSCGYPPFLDLRDGTLLADLLSAVVSYSSDITYRAFAVTQEAHGTLSSSVKDFLARFCSAAPKSLGPAVGSGVVFYFGAEDNRFASSIALDLSRVTEEAIFVKLVAVYDASQVSPAELLEVSQSQFTDIIEECGLELAGE